jgi:tetrahydromethanopterin S-methyltransferase subunit F
MSSANYAQQISDFNATLDAYYNQLLEQATVIKNVRIAVYSEKTEVVYKTNTISLEGGMNIIVAAVIGLVVGFIIAGVIICSLDMPKYLKERKEKEMAKSQPEKEKQAE